MEIVRRRSSTCTWVYPPRGRVRVAAPLHLDDEAVRTGGDLATGMDPPEAVRTLQSRTVSLTRLVTGESHYFLGRRYRLDVMASRAGRGATDGPLRH